MKQTELKPGEKYYHIDNYTMKCRLYPNKQAAQAIDAAIHCVKRAYNMAVYDMWTNLRNTTEKTDKNGNIIHFPDLKSLTKKEYLAEISNGDAPAGALSTNNGIFLNDLKKQLSSQVKGSKKSGNNRPIEKSKPRFYSKAHPRRSYTYQEKLSKISTSDNKNICYITLAKVGKVKIRGWNQRLRFDENGQLDFLNYAQQNPRKQVTVTVSKDPCGDYWICFRLASVYKQMREAPPQSQTGIDVGIKDVSILSDGSKFENKYFKKKQKHHLKALNRRLSRRRGHSNEVFRKERKAAAENDIILMPSKRYEQTRLAHAKLERKIARQREYYNHNFTAEIIRAYEFIGVESLNVKGMFRNKHLSKALTDASMGSILSMLSYKSAWYQRTIQPIDMWTPSSKRCHCCGYIKKQLTLSIREWTCPDCGTRHDRDINAAKNILSYALEAYHSNSQTA